MRKCKFIEHILRSNSNIFLRKYMHKYLFFQYGIKLFSKFLAMCCYAKRSVGTNPEVVSR